jgi:hypothetical protein
MSGSQRVGMTWSERVIESIAPQVPRLGVSLMREKLSRMLRNTRQNYPTAIVWRRKGAYGVSMGDNTYLRVSFSADCTAEKQRDLLELFAVWLEADPEALLLPNGPLGG